MRAAIYATIFATGIAASIPASAAIPPSRSVLHAVADPARAPERVATDAERQPAATLQFAGVKPGMHVGEFFPGGGYFTQMLSDVVGPKGHIYGIENAGWKSAAKADQDLVADQKLSNASIAVIPFGTVDFPEPLDLVWVTQNYHDLKIAEYGKIDTAAFNRSIFAALKPGGTYFILDHEAPAGTDLAAIARLHRIEKSQVIKEVTAAGFRLVAEGTFLNHDDDDHTLPIFDKKVRGHTDQYALKFIKPKG